MVFRKKVRQREEKKLKNRDAGRVRKTSVGSSVVPDSDENEEIFFLRSVIGWQRTAASEAVSLD